MNKRINIAFRRLTSPVASVFLWLFLGTFVIDAANLDDLVPGNVVLHPESGDASGDQTPVTYREGDVQARAVHHGVEKVWQNKQLRHTRPVIDQDSPSLAAEPLAASLSTDRMPEDPHQMVDSVRPAASLYLLNCTLLI